MRGWVAEQLGEAGVEAVDSRVDVLTRWATHVTAAGVDPRSCDPLYACCPCASDCWWANTPRPQKMGVRLPWVGPDYERFRILLLAVNSREPGNAEAEFTKTQQVKTYLRAGSKREGRSHFHYRAACTLTAIASWVAGSSDGIHAEPAAEAVIHGLDTSSRAQAVLCSPDTARGTPTGTMKLRCPERLLTGQLSGLDPSVLVVFGQPGWWWLDRHYRDSFDYRNGVRWGSVSVVDRPVTVFHLPHPASTRQPSWRAAQTQLCDLLSSAQTDPARPLLRS